MDILRKAFRDIAAGHSSGFVLSRPAFVKHLSYADQIDHDLKRDEFYNEAKSQGLFTNEEKLAQLRAEGRWTDQMEKQIKESRQMIDGMHEGKKSKMNMPSLVQGLNKQIKEEEEKLTGFLAQKDTLLGLTCETYAERQISDHYIFSNIFKDKELNESFFTADEFDYLTEEEISTVARDYNRIIEGCAEQQIKRLAMQPFFQNYFGLVGDNLSQFFGKSIAQLTFFQVSVIRYGAQFRHIYQNNEVSKWPKNVLEDPDLLADYAVAAQKGKEQLQQQGGYDPDAIIVGMNKEDSKALGVKSQNNLARQIAAQGGSVLDWAAKQG